MLRMILVACLCLISLHATGTSQENQGPNVVIIMADDMGYSDLGCFGGEIQTPNLDRLGYDGLRFSNFYSENMCWVSRAAMLTGVYHKTSMVDKTIHAHCQTLPEALRLKGYQTLMSGKWHLAGRKTYPVDRGFDQHYGILDGAASFFAPASLVRGKKNVEQEAHDDPDYYFTDAVSDEAVKMIEQADAKKPVFLYLAYTAAHWPLHAKEEDINAYEGKYKQGWDKMRNSRLARMKKLGLLSEDTELSPRHENVPAWEDTKHKPWQERRMEVYAAQVTSMDRGIGRVVDALKKTNRFEDTLIFFTVDNGGCHVEYSASRKGSYLPAKTRDGRPVRPGNLPEIMPGPEDTYQSYGYGWANASNTPYRKFKQFDHEGGIRTPMIAHWPNGIVKPKQIMTTPSHLVDILPTVLELAGSKLPNNGFNGKTIPLDGISLTKSFVGVDIVRKKPMFWHHASGRAYRLGDMKIVREKNQPWELYDLSKDPLELNNLADKDQATLTKLVDLWETESKRHANQAALGSSAQKKIKKSKK